ncbi:MAG: SnoaL-like domain-containing protein [Acidimicrobiales bacterium]|nr:SnoaL-like domain-containing protein [Acidimicrobiales bacterium]
MDPDPHPARLASRRSMAAVEAGDRDAWLALYSPDAVIEDPIGPSMFDESGEGHRGTEAIAAFYDTVIAPNAVHFEIDRSYACGSEVANVGRVVTTLLDGSRAIVNGVFTYRVDADGLIVALRAYWEVDAITIEPPTAG